MRSKSLLCALLLTFTVQSQNLFAPDSIRQVEIFFSQPNWDYLLDSMATAVVGTGTGQGRLLGTVIIDGNVFDSCGVRYKGNSTYDPSRDKNPLNIDLNWIISGQEYMGVDKIKLANEWTDPAFIRDALMYELGGDYMHIPRANYAKVWINGDYKGLYCNTEHIGNEFLNAHFGENNGPFFKCDPRSFVLFGDNSNLSYQTDSMAYDTLYDMKSDYGLAALQEVCFELENNPTTIENHMDVDRVLWFHALSNAYVHLDGYTAFAHNYYVYKDLHGRWSPVLWDLNLSFGGLPYNGLGLFPLNVQQLQQLTPYLMINNPNYRPLIARILDQPRYFKMYNAHYRTIKEEQIDTDLYWQRAQYWHALADSIMAYEPYNNYSYSDFQNNLTNDVGNFLSLRPGIRNLMLARKNYLDTVAWLNLPQPDILNQQVVTASPGSYQPVIFNAEVADADTVILGYKQGLFNRFIKVQMYDDGAHDDGASGDGIYGVTILPGAGDLQYYIYAENATGARFSPARAEYEFHQLILTSPLVLNEIQSDNGFTVRDQDLEFDDWIELYNNSSDTISLLGYHLTDDNTDLNKWAFPDTIIAPDEYLIVWADNDLMQAGLHASFRISATGESVLLTAPSGSTIDEVIVPPLNTDDTFGRFPNGVGPWQVLMPSHAANNGTNVGINEPGTDISLIVYPNPSNGQFIVRSGNKDQVLLEVFSLQGQRILAEFMNDGIHLLDLDRLPDGLYLLRSHQQSIRLVKRSSS